MSRRNVFDWPLFSIFEIVERETLCSVLAEVCQMVLREIGASSECISRVLGAIGSQRRVDSERELEQELKRIVHSQITTISVLSALETRARKVAAQVGPWLLGSSLIDIGCGDGVVALL